MIRRGLFLSFVFSNDEPKFPKFGNQFNFEMQIYTNDLGLCLKSDLKKNYDHSVHLT